MQIHRLLLRFVIILAAGHLSPREVRSAEEVIASTAEKEAVISQVLELINERKLDEAFELYAEDYIYHGPGHIELRGRDGIRGLWNDFLVGFPDLHSTVDEMISQGDKLVLRWTVRGTHTGLFWGVPASNNKITLPITEIFRIEGGQLVEAWDQWDRLHLMRQIGGPPGSIPGE